MRMILLGAPASGKGSVAKYLCQLLSIPHISTGDIFRHHMKTGTELGKEAKLYIDQGKLVPDELTNALVATRLADADAQAGFVFDGYPRTTAQAASLEALLEKLGLKLDLVLDLEVPDEMVIERAVSRKLCPKCGYIYNTITIKPKVAEQCDFCNTRLITRADDSRETMIERLEAYHAQTEPLIAYYQSKGLLRRMQNTVSPEQSREIVKAMMEEFND